MHGYLRVGVPLGCAFGVLLLAGCRAGPGVEYGSLGPVVFPREYVLAEEKYLAGDYAGAGRSFESLGRDALPGVGLWAQYWLARCRYEEDRFREAEELFREAAAARNAPPELRARARKALADIEFETHRREEALEHYLAIEEDCLLAEHVRADEVAYRIAVCLKETGRHEAAKERFERLSSGPSLYARKARGHLDKGDIYVQAGVFAHREGAEKTASKLRLAGFAPAIVAVKRDNRIHLAVRIGPFTTSHEAERDAARIKALGIDAVVVQ